MEVSWQLMMIHSELKRHRKSALAVGLLVLAVSANTAEATSKTSPIKQNVSGTAKPQSAAPMQPIQKRRPESKNPKANYFLRQAEDALKHVDHSAVLENCRQALENDPKLAKAFAVRGMSFMQRKRWDKAIADAERAIRLDPETALAYIVRGKSGYLSGLQSNDQINRDFEHAVRLDPNVQDGYFCLGIMCTVNKDYQRSADCLTKALKMDPLNKNIYQYRSACYSLMKKPDLALVDLGMVIKLDPNAYEAFATRADVYSRLGKNEQAVADFTEAIKLRPREYTLRNLRAALFIKMGKHHEAVKDYSEAIALNPLDEDLFLRRANEYMVLKEFQKALTDYSESISLEPEYETAYVLRAKVYDALGKRDLAAKDRARAAELKRLPEEKKI